MTSRTANSPTNSTPDAVVTESDNGVEHPVDTPLTPPGQAPQTPVEAPIGTDNGEQGQDTDPTAQLASLTAERDALALQVARLTVAAETGVPAELLRGDDEGQLREHAEALKAYAAPRAVSDFGAGNRGDSIKPPDTDPLRRLIGR